MAVSLSQSLRPSMSKLFIFSDSERFQSFEISLRTHPYLTI